MRTRAHVDVCYCLHWHVAGAGDTGGAKRVVLRLFWKAVDFFFFLQGSSKFGPESFFAGYK